MNSDDASPTNHEPFSSLGTKACNLKSHMTAKPHCNRKIAFSRTNNGFTTLVRRNDIGPQVQNVTLAMWRRVSDTGRPLPSTSSSPAFDRTLGPRRSGNLWRIRTSTASPVFYFPQIQCPSKDAKTMAK
ncbi:hypothetical protein HBI54_068900 [Parastagonospora nodorum]|nr:hypothetical protein HBI54_068900 [Parastagonospora nodorum]